MSSKPVPAAWEVRHITAFTHPRADERDLVTLCKVINSLINHGYGHDEVLRPGIEALIRGAVVMTEADWGPRLDMGSTREFLRALAERIGMSR